MDNKIQFQKKYTQDDFYSDKYSDENWLNQRKKDAVDLLDRVSPLITFTKESVVLDVGSGSGDFGDVLIKKHGSIVHGIDLNEVGVNRAREVGMDAKLADLDQKWPYPDKFFDVVSGAEIIEHVLDPDHLVLEAHRTLKDDGYLIIQTPNLACWFNRIIFLAGYQPFFTEVSTKDKTVGLSLTKNLTPIRDPVGHIRVFTLKALKDLLELHGFKTELITGETVHYLPWYMDIIDSVMSKIPSLATDITIVAKKKIA